MIYYIADLNFGCTEQQPSQDINKREARIIRAWQERVRPEDTVYILGDLTVPSVDPDCYLQQLPGKKHLISGDCDTILTQLGLEEVTPMRSHQNGGRNAVLCQYPMLTWAGKDQGSYLIHGNGQNGDGTRLAQMPEMDRALNAGAEVNGYQPVTFEELLENNRVLRENTPDPVCAYLELANERPDLFAPSQQIPLVMEEEAIRTFARERKRPMGIVYQNLPYYMVLADLCGTGDRLYSYARVVYPQQGSNGAVAIPRWNGKFGLLQIFRHTIRAESLEFPRGFAEKDLTPEENIRKELREEMNADVSQVQYLGDVRADTGLSSGKVQVFLADVTSGCVVEGYEGIRKLLWISEDRLREMIAAGEITDGFTLSALARYWCRD